MRRVLVTGCAGFIGSHLAEACLSRGDRVLGVDSMTDYYSVDQKRDNVRTLERFGNFEFVQEDVAHVARAVVDGIDVIFHEAGQPGVRDSWGESFDAYLSANVAATQRLLEAAVAAATPRFVFASSASVYGNALTYPVHENECPRPLSPYGVTKLAAEHLCALYATNHGLSTVSLRYFSVYGPRQRPDMALHRLIECGLAAATFVRTGDGSAIRDLTFVDDVVRANLAAAEADIAAGTVANVAGGALCALADLISIVEETLGATIVVEAAEGALGDVRCTSGAVDLARRTLGWEPSVPLVEGIRRQVSWHRTRDRVHWFERRSNAQTDGRRSA